MLQNIWNLQHSVIGAAVVRGGRDVLGALVVVVRGGLVGLVGLTGAVVQASYKLNFKKIY